MSRSCLHLVVAVVTALALPAAAHGQSSMSMSAGSQGKTSDSVHKTARPARKRAAKRAMATHKDGMKQGDAMKHGDAMMKHDAMMKPDAMKKDGAMMKPDNAMKKPL